MTFSDTFRQPLEPTAQTAPECIINSRTLPTWVGGRHRAIGSPWQAFTPHLHATQRVLIIFDTAARRPCSSLATQETPHCACHVYRETVVDRTLRSARHWHCKVRGGRHKQTPQTESSTLPQPPSGSSSSSSPSLSSVTITVTGSPAVISSLSCTSNDISTFGKALQKLATSAICPRKNTWDVDVSTRFVVEISSSWLDHIVVLEQSTAR